MFFKIVTVKYKKKRYQYLRVMESYRKGNKVKQKDLMTLASLNRIAPEEIQPVMEEFKNIQVYCSALNEYVPGCAWISLLIALDMVFQPKKPCPLPIMQQILKSGRERKREQPANKENFFDYLRQPYPSITTGLGDLILYIDECHTKEDNEHHFFGYLTNMAGFPLYYLFLKKDVLAEQNLGSLITALSKAYNVNSIITAIPGKLFENRFKHFSLSGFEVLSQSVNRPQSLWPEDQLMIFTATGQQPAAAGHICESYYYLLEISTKIKNVTGQPVSPEEHLNMCIMAHSLAGLIESNIKVKMQLFAYTDKKPVTGALKSAKTVR